MSSNDYSLSKAKYGKQTVKVMRVVRRIDHHELVEYTVGIALEGQIENSFTKADNSVVVATDSMKNTVHVFAKTSPHVLVPELFSIHLGLHFLSEYPRISRASISIESHRWSRIPVSNVPHPHSFIRDGTDTIQVQTIVYRDADRLNKTFISLASGLKDLLVLKTTGSSFENFIRDQWTTLPEVSDRILSTSIEYTYQVDIPAQSIEINTIDKLPIDFKHLSQSIRQITLDTFCNEKSVSVQATLYKICELVLSSHSVISDISYTLPNKHYVPIDLSWHHGIKNTSVKDAEVYLPLESPAGLITATVSRKSTSPRSHL